MLFLSLAFLAMPVLHSSAVTPSVALGTAAPFAVLAYSGITNTGTTTITGDVGSYPTASETGFGTVTITGTNYPAGAPSTTQTDLAGAITQAMGYAPTPILAALDAQTLVAGVYASASGAFTLSGGVLTLNGEGDSSSVWIFQAPQAIAGALSTTGGSIVLENGADSCNVFWVTSAGGATIGTSTAFVGTIMAYSSVTLGTGSSLQGAALANTGDVTMQSNTISTACIMASITSSSTSSSTSSTTSSTSSTTSSTSSTTTASTSTTTTTPCVYLTVVSESENGTVLTGEYSDIWNSQAQTQPITACVPPNTTETVGVFDSGHNMFSHWLDTGSALRFRTFSISSNTTFTAVYTDTNVPTPPTDSIIAVSTVSSSNAAIPGLYVTLWQNGVLNQSCFSSCQFVVSNGQTYQVAVADWSSYVFNHWTSGSTDRFRTVVVGDTTSTIALVAVYGVTAGVPQSPRIAQAMAIQSIPATIRSGPSNLSLTSEAGAVFTALAFLGGLGSILGLWKTLTTPTRHGLKTFVVKCTP
jgi:hypothetical protein